MTFVLIIFFIGMQWTFIPNVKRQNFFKYEWNKYLNPELTIFPIVYDSQWDGHATCRGKNWNDTYPSKNYGREDISVYHISILSVPFFFTKLR